MPQPNLTWLELDITYVCGLSCVNCNRMTQLMPGQPYQIMRLEQVEQLIDASQRLQYPWREWFLVGGEPTTHPHLEDIVRRIARYRDRRGPENFRLSLATHGYGRATQQRLRELTYEFPFLRILNSHKRGPIHSEFVAPCVAPIDRAPQALQGHRYIGCGVSWHCGLSYNYAGLYCCAVAAAIDRLRGSHDAITRLDDVNETTVRNQYQVFCPLCGYYTCGDVKPITGSSYTLLSPSWHKLLATSLAQWTPRIGGPATPRRG